MRYFPKVASTNDSQPITFIKNRREDLINLSAGFGAGTTAAFILNPLDIYIKKVQDLSGKTNPADVARAKEEIAQFKKQLTNPKTMFKTWTHGYGPKALKVGLSGALTFLLYNRLKQALDRRVPSSHEIIN